MAEEKSTGLKFVFNHDELKKFLNESETIEGAKKKLLLEVEFHTTNGFIEPKITATTMHVHPDNSITMGLSGGGGGCPYPPGCK